jgi:polysaccharide export outer membrane protein
MAKMGWLRSAQVAVLACAASLGCVSTQPEPAAPPVVPLPKELNKVVLPDYVIEPPDILEIGALNIVPKPPYRIAPLDVLFIQVPNAFPTDPISAQYQVTPEGTVNLGASYGTVKVSGMTLDEAKTAIEEFLKPRIKDVKAFVVLAQSRALQLIRGLHLVTPDGKVRFGAYGAVRVAGLTVPQAKAAMEAHLAQYLESPELSVDVVGYNSKVYYVILDGGGNGQSIIRLPVTGNDTVLDAMGQVGGLTALSSRHRIWVARPAPETLGCDQVLPVDWVGITTRGRVATNYQLLPGDRIYVEANPLVTLDTFLARLYAPIERTLGITLLGAGTVSAIVNVHSSGNGNGSGTSR